MTTSPRDQEQRTSGLSAEEIRHARRRLLSYAGQQKFGWALAVIGIFLSTLALMLVLREVNPLIDVALPKAQNAATRADGLREIQQILLYMIGLTLLGNLLNRQSNEFIVKLAQNLAVTLRTDYHAGLMRQGLSFFRQHEVGSLLSIGINDAETITNFFMDDLSGLLNYAGQLALAVVFMISLKWQLALGSMVVAGVIYGLSFALIVPRSRSLAARTTQHLARVNATLNENLTGARDIQIFTQEARTTRHFHAELKALASFVTGTRGLSLWNSAIFYTVGGLGLALIYGLGALGVVNGQFEVGLLIAFAGFFSQFLSPIKALGSAFVEIQSVFVAAHRVFSIMDTPPEIQERPGAVDPGPLKGHVKFENVTFSYTPGDVYAWRVKNVNLEILPGEKVAFVGGSGSGKSTLVNLVARFYDVTGGRVTIDGYDVRDLKLDALRKNFGLVAQNVILFQGTVADNIRFARPDADMNAVQAAAETAYVTEFLEKLDNSYETQLGEFGQGLSGGQTQRVSIARAALPDPRILILDEATSALDPQSEAVVMKALDQLSTGRTTLVISHRLNTIVNADKIVVLGADENGHGVVRAVGQHDQLLETSPEYVELWGKFRRKAILMPIGPLYDTTAALPTVMGLARAYNAPTHILDFGPLDTTAEVDKRFGVTVVRGVQKDPRVINLQHTKRVHDILKTLRAEGIEADTVSPASKDVTWVEATIQAIEQTQATHLVAVDNVMVPLDELRESIRQIERKAAVEYILVNPIAGAEMG